VHRREANLFGGIGHLVISVRRLDLVGALATTTLTGLGGRDATLTHVGTAFFGTRQHRRRQHDHQGEGEKRY